MATATKTEQSQEEKGKRYASIAKPRGRRRKATAKPQFTVGGVAVPQPGTPDSNGNGKKPKVSQLKAELAETVRDLADLRGDGFVFTPQPRPYGLQHILDKWADSKGDVLKFLLPYVRECFDAFDALAKLERPSGTRTGLTSRSSARLREAVEQQQKNDKRYHEAQSRLLRGENTLGYACPDVEYATALIERLDVPTSLTPLPDKPRPVPEPPRKKQPPPPPKPRFLGDKWAPVGLPTQADILAMEFPELRAYVAFTLGKDTRAVRAVASNITAI
jgi:hypothetical protein